MHRIVHSTRLSKTAQRALFGVMAVLLTFSSVAVMSAQNLGSSPQFNVAVQGQQAAQPEGALLNAMNWFGNVICPVVAVAFVARAVMAYQQGRGFAGNAITAGGALAVSGLTRVMEGFITQGTSGVS